MWHDQGVFVKALRAANTWRRDSLKLKGAGFAGSAPVPAASSCARIVGANHRVGVAPRVFRIVPLWGLILTESASADSAEATYQSFVATYY
jgi:hypothetical protein